MQINYAISRNPWEIIFPAPVDEWPSPMFPLGWWLFKWSTKMQESMQIFHYSCPWKCIAWDKKHIAALQALVSLKSIFNSVLVSQATTWSIRSSLCIPAALKGSSQVVWNWMKKLRFVYLLQAGERNFSTTYSLNLGRAFKCSPALRLMMKQNLNNAF